MDKKETKTKFKGPGEWRSQARRLEQEAKQAELVKKAKKKK